MSSMLQDLENLIWIILPLIVIQISLMGTALWQWYKKKNFLGQYKIIWILIILLMSFFGPIIFLIYSQGLETNRTINEDGLDEWEV
ncbi:MAG: PLDc N-terminal domain-containing protein [Candidatus Hodarchaeota archaeon]